MVTLTDTSADYWQRLEAQHTLPLWRMPETPPEPRVPEAAHVWHWRDVYPLLLEAAEVMDIDADAQRRVIMFRNPSQKHPGTTQTLNAALQLVTPGEIAPAHRHTMSALRFVIDAASGYTVVDGEPVPMRNGDMILTPGWTWHDHKNADTQQPMVWFDGLDVPFVQALRQAFYQDFPGNTAQPLTTDANPASPQLYTWDATYSALKQAQESGEADPCDGFLHEYRHRTHGGHVLPTIACYLQLLPAGFKGRAHRHTASNVYFVARGSGHSVVNGKRLDWQARDTFVVPTWAWHEHAADASGEAVLFSISDLPILEPFGFVRRETA